MELRIAQSALEDLQAIKEFYVGEGDPQVGNDLVAKILESTDMLLDHPDAGRIVPEFELDYIRELIHPPFRVVYLRQEQELVLIRVWHSERQLELPQG